MAALEDSNGQRILAFNQAHKVKIGKHLEKIPQRLDADTRPDGVYYVLMAYNISGTKTPDRYPLVKGKVEPEVLAEAEKKIMPLTPVQIVNPEPAVRGWDEALADKQAIANLTSEVERLKNENSRLTAQVEELEAELEEADQGGQLAEGAVNPTVAFLKEQSPTLIALADRYFGLQEKRLELDALKLNGGSVRSSAGRKQSATRRPMVPGSPPHLQLIRHYFSQGNDARMNAELDKLEQANPEAYAAITAELGLEDEGGEQNG